MQIPVGKYLQSDISWAIYQKQWAQRVRWCLPHTKRNENGSFMLMVVGGRENISGPAGTRNRFHFSDSVLTSGEGRFALWRMKDQPRQLDAVGKSRVYDTRRNEAGAVCYVAIIRSILGWKNVFKGSFRGFALALYLQLDKRHSVELFFRHVLQLWWIKNSLEMIGFLT